MLLIISTQITLLLLTSSLLTTTSLTTDGLALLALKSAITSDPTRFLSNWADSDPDPCHWHGVVCSSTRRVTSLTLHTKDLSGYLPSELGLLDSLTRLILSGNNFSGPIPPRLVSSALNLRTIDLSQNSLVGPIPPDINSIKSLTHLDLSSNSLNGSLPESLSELKSLSGTLNLSYNSFSGEIPASYGNFTVMVSLDLRHNNLTGKVPLVGSLVNQGPTAFSGNPGLCGFPLDTQCPEAVNIPGGPINPMKPKDSSTPGAFAAEEEKQNRRNRFVSVPLISGVSLVIGAVSVSVWIIRRKFKNGKEKGRTGNEEKMVEGNGNNSEEGQDGKFVVIDEGFNLDMEDLLRASAYVVGKSRCGIVYKVVVGAVGVGRGSGAVVPTVVAVRRLSEGDATWKFKDFDSEVEGIGRLQHPNIVRLKAYYYASDEKLLVSDFVRNGSLWNALHGGPSSTCPQLSWAARLKIAQGTARGLMYIHEYNPRKYVHGNFKSTKILLDDELQPLISGFGLTRLVSSNSKFTATISRKQYSTPGFVIPPLGSAISSSLNVYLAPEARVSGCKYTQKSDVYSFGIVLMELLTRRVPDAAPENDGKGIENLVRKVFREQRPLSEIIDPTLLGEVQAKKQVIAMFHIALNCTELDPELRPRMRMVSESLDRIKLH